MLMRKRPIRGQKIGTSDGIIVTVLEEVEKDFVKVIMLDGKLTAIIKSNLDLEVIDTRAYEKMG